MDFSEENPNASYTLYEPCLKCEACLERQTQGEKAGVDDINDYEIKKSHSIQ